MVGNVTPPEVPAVKEKTIKWWKIIFAMFIVGLAMGACSLGMKLPVALFELVTG